MSPLDSLLIALGRTKSPVALKPILEKVGQLNSDSEFSHFRAIAIALETLADKSAAPPLAALLQKPGLGGHAVTTIDAALAANPRSATDTTVRNQALSELYLARALSPVWRPRRPGGKDPARILARSAWPLRPPRQSRPPIRSQPRRVKPWTAGLCASRPPAESSGH